MPAFSDPVTYTFWISVNSIQLRHYFNNGRAPQMLIDHTISVYIAEYKHRSSTITLSVSLRLYKVLKSK